MADFSERPCPRCGLILGPFDESCPRCARLAQTKCSQCGQLGTIGTCERCHQDVCEACATRTGQHELHCRSCLALASGAAKYVPPQPANDSGSSYALPETGLATGLFPSLSRALIFMREALLMGFRDVDLMLPSLISLFAGLVLLAGLYFGAVGLGIDLEAFFDRERTDAAGWLLILIIGVAGAFVHYFAVGVTVSLVASHLRGENARIGTALQDALRHAGAILVLAVVSTVVNGLASAARRRRIPLAGEVMQELWRVASYLIIPVIMLEGQSFSGAGRRAYDLHSKNLLGIAVGEIGVDVVSRVAFFVFFLAVLALIFWGALISHAIAIPIGLGLAFLGLLVLGSFQMYFRTAYYTCLYLWAAQREQAAEAQAVPAPAPLARALGY